MTIKVYRDEDANAAVLETGVAGTIGMRFNNELRAVGNGDNTISILNPPKSTDTDDFAEIVRELFSAYTDENDTQLGSDEATTVNALNAILRHTGGVPGDPPVITSATTISVTDGDPINYTLVATNGVGYEWSNLPPGLSIQNGNPRKLIGTITAGVGTYTPTMTATNYYGQDTETLTINVTGSGFNNTKSIEFENQDYLGANASLLNGILGRTGNGSGSSDAWSISLWFKPSVATSGQTIFYFGDNDPVNSGTINIRFLGANDNIRLQYGSNNNYLRFQSANNSVPANTWHHIMITYDGGTTGVSSSDLSDYYSRFKIFINGSDAVPSGAWSHNNFGYSGGIDPDNLRVGRFSSGNYLKQDAKVDELAIWNGDQSSLISDIYNGGSPDDLSTLSTTPDHWWRMGDGDTYPNIQDNVGSATFVMFNMTAADIVNDVP